MNVVEEHAERIVSNLNINQLYGVSVALGLSIRNEAASFPLASSVDSMRDILKLALMDLMRRNMSAPTQT